MTHLHGEEARCQTSLDAERLRRLFGPAVFASLQLGREGRLKNRWTDAERGPWPSHQSTIDRGQVQGGQCQAPARLRAGAEAPAGPGALAGRVHNTIPGMPIVPAQELAVTCGTTKQTTRAAKCTYFRASMRLSRSTIATKHRVRATASGRAGVHLVRGWLGRQGRCGGSSRASRHIGTHCGGLR